MTLKEMIENFKKKVESNPHYQEAVERLKKAAEASKNIQNKTGG